MKNRFSVDASGFLQPAKQFTSPNQNDRPLETPVSLLVIHNISLPPGEFGGDSVAELFLNTLDCTKHPYYERLKDLKVSSHLFIRRDGEVVQFVPFHKRAWHAGTSCFQGIPDCNDYSIGIELEGCDDQPFTDAQYATLVEVSRAIMHRYPAINLARITGHSDIAPGRKTDPGPCFDWARYKASLIS
ncbi:MAG: N-acetyl-anhydromuranmyl-L-alanine amidase [Gammaproteobacteria bacterium]|jgi:AmpD protein|nr:N-acetyl-anhydromuranmyl-L-alanine amidase [Gammaproteobacteria bacterium]